MSTTEMIIRLDAADLIASMERLSEQLANRNLDGSTQEPVVQSVTETDVSRTASVQSARTAKEFGDWLRVRRNEQKAIKEHPSNAADAEFHNGYLCALGEVLCQFTESFRKELTAKRKEAILDRAD